MTSQLTPEQIAERAKAMKQLKSFATSMREAVKSQQGEFVTVNRVMLDELAFGCLEAIGALDAKEKAMAEQREYFEGVIADGGKRIADSEDRVRKQNRHICELFDDNTALRQRISELEEKLESSDKLQDSAFRHGLQHGFSLGQTDDQNGFEQCMVTYSKNWGGK